MHPTSQSGQRRQDAVDVGLCSTSASGGAAASRTRGISVGHKGSPPRSSSRAGNPGSRGGSSGSSRQHFGAAGPRRTQSVPPPNWNGRHHVVIEGDNTMRPASLRAYFSRPQSINELCGFLKDRGDDNEAHVLATLDPPRKRTVLSNESGETTLPQRHMNNIAVRMTNRRGEERPWNPRWNSSVSSHNSNLYRTHREFFDTKSVFSVSASQRWRRMLEVQLNDGSWVLND